MPPRSDKAVQVADELRDELAKRQAGASVKEPTQVKDGSLVSELGAFVYPLNDLDTWYSIVASSVIGHLLNSNVKMWKPANTTFMRELSTFTLFELLQPKLSGYLPRPLIDSGDIDHHRYSAYPQGPLVNPRIEQVSQSTLIGTSWDWDLMFREVLNSAPVMVISMVIVDVFLGKRSDFGSLLHYMFVLLLVGVTRYAKNTVILNNPARQSSVEIFRRAMLLGRSFNTVPTVTTDVPIVSAKPKVMGGGGIGSVN